MADTWGVWWAHHSEHMQTFNNSFSQFILYQVSALLYIYIYISSCCFYFDLFWGWTWLWCFNHCVESGSPVASCCCPMCAFLKLLSSVSAGLSWLSWSPSSKNINICHWWVKLESTDIFMWTIYFSSAFLYLNLPVLKHNHAARLAKVLLLRF